MCGIAGFISTKGAKTADSLKAVALDMATAIRHRGPDAAGAWSDSSCGIGLGHRRLSIIDLSATGAQPMQSASGRFVLVYNGEIYNYRELRREIEGCGAPIAWRGTSDTEVVLAAFETWGIAEAMSRLSGMFAMALWDKSSRTLCLARDRMGEKPLYYGWSGNTFLFGSELKALRAHPQWQGEIDRGALCSFLRHDYVPAPRSIYRGISKLTPGTTLVLRHEVLRPGETPEPRSYWSLAASIASSPMGSRQMTDGDAVAEAETLLKDAVGKQMVADVPLGAFLSGGIDSSTIVALMQAQSARPVKTFTIGFDEAQFNEAEYAREVAQHLGTEHHELYVTSRETMDVIPLLPAMYDEPFADSSQIPTYLVSKLARSHVTVSLSGDGGDELFCGYNRYFWGESIFRRIRGIPAPLRKALGAGLAMPPPGIVDAAYAAMRPALPRRFRISNPSNKLQKLAAALAHGESSGLYRELVSHWTDPAQLVVGGSEPPPLAAIDADGGAPREFVPWMMYADTLTYLPDDILVKVDRAAMSVSLESRVPLLDPRVVEFAWSLPMHLKLRNGTSKWILREVLYRHVPKRLIERPKMGFGVPIGAWLRGPLRDWAEALLDERRLDREGFLRPVPIRRAWAEHLSGRHDWQYHLWSVLMFQAWLAHPDTGPSAVRGEDAVRYHDSDIAT